MKSYAIVIKDNATSEAGYQELVKSSSAVDNEFQISRFDAITPETVDSLMTDLNIEWNWPHTGSIRDNITGITKIGYGGKDPRRRRACGMSHYMLWKECAETNDPILVFEHDAIFLSRLDVEPLIQSKYSIIGLNDPRGNTRLASTFHSIVQNSNSDILPVPEIDRPNIAQGLAGNSTYLIKPVAANELLELVNKHGMWNNDAIMCRQLMPDMIGVTKTYYTSTQKISSTTMG